MLTIIVTITIIVMTKRPTYLYKEARREGKGRVGEGRAEGGREAGSDRENNFMTIPILPGQMVWRGVAAALHLEVPPPLVNGLCQCQRGWQCGGVVDRPEVVRVRAGHLAGVRLTRHRPVSEQVYLKRSHAENNDRIEVKS